MTEPFQVCENSGDTLSNSPPDCGPAPGQPQKWFWVARLTCDPNLAHFEDLSKLTDYCNISGGMCIEDADCPADPNDTCGVDGAIHIFDQGIVPSKNAEQLAIYSVQVIVNSIIAEGLFSDALVVTQPVWGDIGAGTPCPMAPPDGRADIVPDVTGALTKFSNQLCAPKKTRTDVEPASLDAAVAISDVLKLLNAFVSGSADYSFAAGPACSAGE